MDLEKFEAKSKQKLAENKLLIKKLKQDRKIDLDALFYELHEEAFSHIDCLRCANCCKTLGPRLTDKDIEKLSKFLGQKPSVFTDKYLYLDEDHDYVFKNMPCPFILHDNYCQVYDHRPKACKEYPHTNQKKMIGLLHLCIKNSIICPAVLEILEKLKWKIKPKQ